MLFEKANLIQNFNLNTGWLHRGVISWHDAWLQLHGEVVYLLFFFPCSNSISHPSISFAGTNLKNHGWNTRSKKALGSVQVNWSLHSVLYLRLPHSIGPLFGPPLLLCLILSHPTRALSSTASAVSGFWWMVQKEASSSPCFSSGFRFLQHSLYLGLLRLCYQTRSAWFNSVINWRFWLLNKLDWTIIYVPAAAVPLLNDAVFSGEVVFLAIGLYRLL